MKEEGKRKRKRGPNRTGAKSVRHRARQEDPVWLVGVVIELVSSVPGT